MTTKSALRTVPLVTAVSTTLMFGAFAHAQTADSPVPTRETVKMETINFLRAHQWDDERSAWVMKSGTEPPSVVKPRDEVKAERDAFLRVHRWNDLTSTWEPVKPGPRSL